MEITKPTVLTKTYPNSKQRDKDVRRMARQRGTSFNRWCPKVASSRSERRLRWA